MLKTSYINWNVARKIPKRIKYQSEDPDNTQLNLTDQLIETYGHLIDHITGFLSLIKEKKDASEANIQEPLSLSIT